MMRLIGFFALIVVAVALLTSAHNNSSSSPQTEGAAPATKPDDAAPDFVMIGRKARVTTSFASCVDKDDLERIKTLLVHEHDQEAANAYFQQHDCRMLSAGTVASVEDNSVWTNNTCVRTAGEANCYWFPQPFLVEATSQ